MCTVYGWTGQNFLMHAYAPVCNSAAQRAVCQLLVCLCKQIALMPYTFCIPNPFRYGRSRGGGGLSRELFRLFPYTTSVDWLSHGDHPRDGQRLTVVLNLRRKKIGFVRRLKRLMVWITGALES